MSNKGCQTDQAPISQGNVSRTVRQADMPGCHYDTCLVLFQVVPHAHRLRSRNLSHQVISCRGSPLLCRTRLYCGRRQLHSTGLCLGTLGTVWDCIMSSASGIHHCCAGHVSASCCCGRRQRDTFFFTDLGAVHEHLT